MILRLLALVLILTAAAEAQTKRAFIVGVGEYDELTNLQKTIGDAEGYARVFRAQDFEVTKLVGTPKRRDFIAAFDGFVRSIGSGDEVVFVFSGHGWSDGSDNYLALNDAPRGVAEAVLRAETIALERNVMARLRARSPKLTFAIIDACRDEKYDPLTRSSGYLEKGIARMSASEGELILYSAGAGQTSLDRLSNADASPYSVFTRILLPKLSDTARPLATIADETRAEVQRLAGTIDHRQRPEMMLGVSLGYCLAGDCRTATVPGPEPVDPEAQAWQAAERLDTLQAYEAYLTFHPNGANAAIARARIDRLRPSETPSPVTTTTTTTPMRDDFGDGDDRTFRDCADCPEMVVIPAGEFRMGSADGGSDETPVRTVRINYQLAVGKHEVTWAESEACVSDGGCGGHRPSDRGWGKGSRPVINVSWNDAQAYVQWLSRKTGERYRLLSEAEWEYVARSGTSARFSWGDGDPTCSRGASNGANFISCSSDRTEPVGFSAANAFGLYDLHGNVWEWVEDCYENSYSGAPTDGSARDASDCSRRVLRGGSWSSGPNWLRSAVRYRLILRFRYSNVGFRVARTL